MSAYKFEVPSLIILCRQSQKVAGVKPQKMSNKNSQAVVAAADKPAENVKLGPKVLMSGYMTKKTRAMNTWKQRWWQLKDDGILLYYKPEDPQKKVCGEIDVGKTCYNVKMGSDTRIKFPKAVASCCCFSFAVLKRVYYVYTLTPGEASSWVSAISGVSRVINRKIVAGLERRKAPENPGGSTDFKITRIKVKGSSLESAGSYQDVSRVQYLPLERNKLALELKRKYAASMPDGLDKAGTEEDTTSTNHSEESNLNVIRNADIHSSSNSLKLDKDKKNELQTSTESAPAVCAQMQCHRSCSMEDLSSPRSPRKPVPTPRTRKGKYVTNESNQVPTNASTLPTASHIKAFSSTLPPNDKLDYFAHPSSNRFPSPFSPPSSPPPPPPDEPMPPPPLTSPPHSRPMLSSPPGNESSKQGSEYDTLTPHFPFPPPQPGATDSQDADAIIMSQPKGMSCVISDNLARKIVQSKQSPTFKPPPPPPMS